MENLRDDISNSYNRYLKAIEQIVQKIHGTPELSEEEVLASCSFQ